MRKDIKQVRKSIAQRKHLRSLKTGNARKRSLTPLLPQEEEKHGYYPIFPENTNPSKGQNKIITGMMLKGILSVMLFLGVAVLFQSEIEMLEKPSMWTNNALTEEFPFARVNKWYKDTFGSPLAFAPNENNYSAEEQALALPVNGKISESFQANGSGIMITPQENEEVHALRAGIVLFAGNDRETDKTVIIQHADGSKTTYGYLDSINVHLYEFVESNQQIGEFVPDSDTKSVYFSIEKDNKFVDPIKVIKVDDVP